MYLLGVDVGTSIIKAVLFDLNGHERGTAARDSVVEHPKPLWAEQDMFLVRDAVVGSIREVVEGSGVRPEEVVAMGITGQGDGTWLVDAQGSPVRPAIIWLDGRSSDLVRSFERQGVSAEIFAITGTMPNTCNQGIQLRWLQEFEPEAIRKAAAALRAKDWIFLCLTGLISTDTTDASHTYFDIHRQVYDDRVFALYGIESLKRLIPEARLPHENKGSLIPEIASRTGLLPGTPVVSGPFDVAASDLGLGVLNPGEACTILGTAGIHQLVLAQPSLVPERVGYNMCHASPGRWIRLLPTMTGALNLQWFMREFYRDEESACQCQGGNIWERLEVLAEEVPPGSYGVIYHPYIDPAGERAPFLFPYARAQFIGLSVTHTRQVMLRAVYEGVVLSALDCYQLLASKVNVLRLGGGGARSKLWAQMFADGLGCPVLTMQGQEFGAKGAAINAAVAIGIYSSFEEAISKMVHLNRVFQPHPDRQPVYQEMLRIYRNIYQAMFPIWEECHQMRQNILPGRPTT